MLKDTVDTIFASIREISYKLDNYGIIQDMSPNVFTHFGFTREELIGTPIQNLYYNVEDRERIYEAVRKNNGEIHNCEVRLKNKAGSPIYVLTSLKMIFGENKNPIGALGSARNYTTTRILSNEILNQSENLLSTIINKQPECVKIVDANGNLLMMNPAGLEMIEAEFMEQVQDAVVLDLILPEYKKAFGDLHKKVIGGTPAKLQFELQGLKGTKRWMETSAVPMVLNGETVHMAHSTDITQRKLAEQRLEKSELILREAQRIAHIGHFEYFVGDETFVTSKINDEILGIDDSYEKNVTNWLEITHPDFRESAYEKFQDAIINNKVLDNLYKIIRQTDKSERWIHSTGEVYRDDSGNPYKVVGVTRDITESINSKEQLEKSEQFLLEAQETGNIGTYDLNLETGVWLASEGMNKIFGIDSDYEKTLDAWVKIIHPEWKDLMADYLTNEVIGKKEKFDKKYKICRISDGAERWIHGHGKLYYDNSGTPYRLAGIIQDITESKIAEERLENSEKSLRESQRIGRIGTYEFNLAEGVWKISEVGQEIFGIGGDYDNTIDGWLNFFDSEERDRIIQSFKDTNFNEENIDLIYRIVRPNDGAERWINAIGKIYKDESGKPIKRAGVVHDITERQISEERLEKSEQLLKEAQRIGRIGSFENSLITRSWEPIGFTKEIFGISEDTLVNFETWNNLIHPDSKAQMDEWLHDIIVNKKEIDLQYKINRANDGAERWVESSVKVYYDDAGNAYRLVGINRDITESKISEERLERSERYLKEVQRIGRIGSYEFNLTEGIWDVSEITKEIFGIEGDFDNTLAGWLNFFDPEEQDRIMLSFQDTNNVQENIDIVYKIIRPNDGNVRWVNAIGKIYKDEFGKPYRRAGVVHDITERKSSEERLEKSEYRLRESQIIGRIGSYELDVAKRTFTTSEICDELFGIDDTYDKTIEGWFKFIHPDSVDHMSNRLEEVLNPEIEGNRLEEIYKIIRPNDGAVRWMCTNGEAFFDDSGNPYRMAGVERDITEQKNAEELLEKSEKSLKEAQRIGRIGTYEFDMAKDFFQSSKITDEIFGIDDSYDKSIVGWLNLFDPEDKDKIIQSFRDANENNENVDLIYKIIRPIDGTAVWVNVIGKIYRDESGKPYKRAGIIHDITERKMSEERLAKSEQSLKEAQNIGRIGSFEFSLVTGIWESSVVNKEILGITEGSTRDMEAWNNLIHPDFRDRMNEYLQDVVRTMGDIDIKFKIIRENDGAERWIESKGKVYADNTGKPSKLAGVNRDITEQIEYEKELIAAKEEAERANSVKDVFLANMSHELRTPLNSLIGYSELLSQTELDASQHEFVANIQTAGSNLSSIVNDIMDLSRIETGSLVMELRPFDLKSCLKQVYNQFKKQASESNLELNLFLDAELPESIVGDQGRLNQIVAYLTSNALKFTSQGEVIISAKLLEQTNEKYRIKFTVKDTGIGIPEDKIETIFERFRQGEESSTRKFGGAGLGLNIVKQIVELMHGEIQVSSQVDKGSLFHFTLDFQKENATMIEASVVVAIPVASAPVAFAPVVSVAIAVNPVVENNPKKISILMCEDNILNQNLIKNILLKYGFDLDIANNGQEGIDLLLKKNYDIILMDLQMPVQDGYQATVEIREVLKLDTPIIAVTANSRIGEKNKCLEKGMNDYLSKPFKQADLLGLIEKFTGKTVGAIPASPVILPRVKHNMVESAVAVPAVPERKKEEISILLCEDNLLNQNLVKNIARKCGFNLDIAANGQEGIDFLLKRSYNIILMDLQMPVKDGLQTVTEIREELKLDIPIIAMTANSDASEKEKCLEVGMDAYLVKPFKQIEFLELIEKFTKKAEKEPLENTAREIDMSYLEDFSGGNAEFKNEMINLFVNSMPTDLDTLEQAILAADFPAVKEIAHHMKSSLSMFCLEDELEQARLIENEAISTKSIAEIKDAFAHLKRGILSVIHSMQDMQLLAV